MAAYPSTTTTLSEQTAKPVAYGAPTVYTIEKTFDLDALMDDKVANADIVNLFTLPANTVILATRLETVVASVGGTGTCTAKLRFGTTDIGAATNILAAAVGVGGNATVNLPLAVGTSDVLVNAVIALGGGTTTTNPTIKATLLVCQMA